MSVSPSKIDFAQTKERFDREARFRTVDTGRYQARAWSWGDGPDLLFIHGMSDRSDSFMLVASQLCRDFRCIGYDLPGIQPNDRSRLFWHRHDHLVEDALAIADDFGAKRALPVAASFGTTIAQKLLAAHPSRFPAGVLQGGFAHRPIGLRNFLLAWGGRFAPKKPLIGVKGYSDILKKVHGQGFETMDPQVWEWFLHCVGNTPIPTMAHQALMISRLDQRKLLPSIRQPVLLITGSLDRTIDARATAPLTQNLPGAILHDIADAGHVPCYTHSELVAHLIRDFAKTHADGAPIRASQERTTP